jgi:hypothetical protein
MAVILTQLTEPNDRALELLPEVPSVVSLCHSAEFAVETPSKRGFDSPYDTTETDGTSDVR